MVPNWSELATTPIPCQEEKIEEKIEESEKCDGEGKKFGTRLEWFPDATDDSCWINPVF